MDSLTVIDELHKLNFKQLTALYRLHFDSHVNESIDPAIAKLLARRGFIRKNGNEWEAIKGVIDSWNGTAGELYELWTYKNESEVNRRIGEENRNVQR